MEENKVELDFGELAFDIREKLEDLNGMDLNKVLSVVIAERIYIAKKNIESERKENAIVTEHFVEATMKILTDFVKIALEVFEEGDE